MRYKEDYRKTSVLTLKMVDQYLEQLTTATKEDDQLDIISNFCDLCTPGTKISTNISSPLTSHEILRGSPLRYQTYGSRFENQYRRKICFECSSSPSL